MRALFFLLLSSFVFAAEPIQEVQVVGDATPVFAYADDRSEVVTKLKQGTLLKSVGHQGLFLALKTKSGKPVWVRAAQVRPIVRTTAADDLEKSEPETITFPHFTFDVSGAAGATSLGSFYEVQGGVNLFANPWLVWRNAPFYRFFGSNSAFGFDTSVRAQKSLGFQTIVPTFMAGVGYRFITQGGNVPFAEAGISLDAARIRLSLGGKLLLNSLLYPGTDNQLLYTFGVSGGASL